MDDAVLCLDGSTPTLEPEGPCHHPDGQGADSHGDLGDNGRCTGAGATTLTGGDEDHVRALDGLLDLASVFFGGLAAHLGIAACTEAPCQLAPDVQLHIGVAHEQGLRIGVHGDELHAADARIDHPVDSVDAGTPDADHLDNGKIVLWVAHHRCLLVLLPHPGGVRIRLLVRTTACAWSACATLRFRFRVWAINLL